LNLRGFARVDGAAKSCYNIFEVIFMTRVTATDFKQNLGRYLLLVKSENVHITKNGEDIAVLTAPKPKRSWVDDITGIIDGDIDERQFKSDRLAAKYENLD
jgi:prevent-host-death family protein